jgi:hypothetical protein
MEPSYITITLHFPNLSAMLLVSYIAGLCVILILSYMLIGGMRLDIESGIKSLKSLACGATTQVRRHTTCRVSHVVKGVNVLRHQRKPTDGNNS